MEGGGEKSLCSCGVLVNFVDGFGDDESDDDEHDGCDDQKPRHVLVTSDTHEEHAEGECDSERSVLFDHDEAPYSYERVYV